MRKNIFTRSFIMIFCLSCFMFIFGCTTVRDPRLRIFCMESKSEGGVKVASEKVIELKVPTGYKVDLETIKFPTFKDGSVNIYGYEDGSDRYILASEKVNGKPAYIFEVENTGAFWNTSMPIPSNGVCLFPVYELDGESSAKGDSQPGVEITFYVNDRNGLKENKVTKYFYENKKPTLYNLNLTPDKLASWTDYDTVMGQTEDKLYYGYVDVNDNNKAYWFYTRIVDDEADLVPITTMVGDIEVPGTEYLPKLKYLFIDEEGNKYNEFDLLDVNKFTRLTPCYQNAGYRPISLNFGNYINGSTLRNLEFDFVYVPGSHNDSWPYEFAGQQSGQYVVDTSETRKTRDVMTIPPENSTQDMLVSEIMLTSKFLGNILKKNYVEHVYDLRAGQVRVHTDKSDIPADHTAQDKAPYIDFYFSSDALVGGIPGTLSDISLCPWITNYFGDAIVASNLLTLIYNLENPDDQLDYVYYTNANFSSINPNNPNMPPKTIINNYADAQDITKLHIKKANGFRLPHCHEFSYFSKIILDERQFPLIDTSNEGITPPSKSIPLCYTPTQLNSKYAFRSADDTGRYQNNGNGGSWLGCCAGLMAYDFNTGSFPVSPTYPRDYDPTKSVKIQTLLRSGSWGMGRKEVGPRTYGDNEKTAESEGDIKLIEQKSGYVHDIKGQKATTPVDRDYNCRNAAGLWNLYGLAFQWCDTHDVNNKIIMRGGQAFDYSSSNASNLRVSSAKAVSLSDVTSFAGVRLCRSL